MSDKKPFVLVVDDNRDAAESMAQYLALSGFAVTACFDGPTALRVCEDGQPDACLIDINMPHMSGYELASQLRQWFADRPPVFATLTAYGDDAHLGRAVAAGFDLQFTKPADPADVADQLWNTLRAAEAAKGEAPQLALVVG